MDNTARNLMDNTARNMVLGMVMSLALASQASAQWVGSHNESVSDIQIGGGSTMLVFVASGVVLHQCALSAFRIDHAERAREMLVLATLAKQLDTRVSVWSTGCDDEGTYQKLDALILD